MKSTEIRQKFFDFFTRHGHTKVPSSSLIPADDPTLLFANAGMNQFKDVFLGKEKRAYTRAVSIQKCIRAGGKHNDLDNVGRTKRHHTFFEMMGNFSFGDYFKQDAIRFAWDFLTKELGMPVDRLHVSIYKDDDESYDIWHNKIGVPAERITRLGAKDNFWQMGDTGPCGPCTEIHFDRGAQTPEEERCKVGDDCERFLEVWNLVFMQYDRQPDGTDIPLQKSGVDTGMGLERLCTILQNAESNYETDLFAGIIKGIEKLSGKTYKNCDAETKVAFRVLADHIRSSCLSIADGATPSNEGRGYVLRKIIRRAALFAQKLGNSIIFADLADYMINEMGDIYPELVSNKDLIKTLLKCEIEKFSHNLEVGQTILEKYLEQNKQTKRISGEQAFKLYDTYGFPIELTNLVAYERGYTVDTPGFEAEMEKQREQSGKQEDVLHELENISLNPEIKTIFTGYDDTRTESTVAAIFCNEEPQQKAEAKKTCWITTKESPFYVESGGQTSDQGTVEISGEHTPVLSLKKIDDAIFIKIKTPATIAVGDRITLHVNEESRSNTLKNHTATHLLQAALYQILGPQIKQAGSLVEPTHLRFDFTHHQAITAHELREIETLVNKKIMENVPVSIATMTYKQAVDKGAKAFFGDKYNPDCVRVVQVPGFSAELCGGTHVEQTGDIGCFKIVSETALSTGVRRITAVTGPEAIKLFQDTFSTIKQLCHEFKVQPDEVLDAVNKQKEELKQTKKELLTARKDLMKFKVPELLESMEAVRTTPFGYFVFEDLSSLELRDIASLLSEKKPGFYFLASETDGTTSFFALCSDQYSSAVDIQAFAAWLKEYGFKGGGKRGTLQGGGATLPEDFKNKIKSWLTAH